MTSAQWILVVGNPIACIVGLAAGLGLSRRTTRRRPTLLERLAAEAERTGRSVTRWHNASTLTWWSRIEGMAGHWETDTEDQAIGVLLAGLGRCPDRTEVPA